MKKLAATFLLVLALHARADLVIVEMLDSMPLPTRTLTVKIKGDMMRTDWGDGLSNITNATTGDTIKLNNRDHYFVRIPAPGAQTAAADAPLPTLPVITDTQKVEQVGDFSAKVYTVEKDEVKFTCWIATEIPNLAAVLEQLKTEQAVERKTSSKSLASIKEVSKLGGVVVKTVIPVKGKPPVVITVLSIKEQSLDAAEFQVPANYKEVLPASPGPFPMLPRP